MPKTPSDSLWKLVQSMTKSERRYFKVHLQKNAAGEENSYGLIFDKLASQKEYDEDALLKTIKSKSYSNSFPIMKRRVYESILRSLDSFHAFGSVEAELKKQLHYAEILFRKTLYDECGRILHSARKLAIRYEKYHILLEIMRWEKKLVEKDSYSGLTLEALDEMGKEDELTLDRIRNFSQYWNIKSRVFLLLNRQGKAREEKDLKDFKKIIDNTLLTTPSRALSYETRYLFYHIYSAYYFGTGDYENSYKNIKKHIELIESHAELFQEEPNKYFAVLTNMIYLCTQLKKFSEAGIYLGKLKSLSDSVKAGKNEDLEVKFFSSVISIELTLCVNSGEFEKGISLVAEIEESLERYGDKINKLREAYIYFYISVLYFAVGRHSLALRWIHKLMSEKKVEESKDIFCFAQMLNLVIHYEHGNADLLPYAIKSTSRYLQTRKRVYRFETVFLGLIGHISKSPGRTALVKLMQDFKSQIQPLKTDAFEKTVFEYFDFEAWADSYITGKLFAELIKEKALENIPAGEKT